MPTATEILSSIDRRLLELRGEIETLSAARDALQPNRPGRANRRDAPAVVKDETAKRRRRGRKRVAPASRNVPKTVAAATGRPAARTAQPKLNGRRRRAVKVTSDSVEGLLVSAGGLSTSELAHGANGDRDQVLALLRELEANGRVRRSGERRGTRWHAITDEDRIEQRAAELAARSKQAS